MTSHCPKIHAIALNFHSSTFLAVINAKSTSCCRTFVWKETAFHFRLIRHFFGVEGGGGGGEGVREKIPRQNSGLLCVRERCRVRMRGKNGVLFSFFSFLLWFFGCVPRCARLIVLRFTISAAFHLYSTNNNTPSVSLIISLSLEHDEAHNLKTITFSPTEKHSITDNL